MKCPPLVKSAFKDGQVFKFLFLTNKRLLSNTKTSQDGLWKQSLVKSL